MRYNYRVKKISSKSKVNLNAGMTYIETMIALAVFVLIIVAMGAFQVSIFQNQRVISGNLQTAQDAQTILKRILVEVRSAVPGASGAYPIVWAATSSLAFFSDPGNDGVPERIAYVLIGTNLHRAVIQPTGTPSVYNVANQSTTTIVVNIRNSTSTPVFQYYDLNYTGTSSPMTYPLAIASIRLIQVGLTLDVNPSLSPVPRTYTTQINLRNLKTNL